MAASVERPPCMRPPRSSYCPRPRWGKGRSSECHRPQRTAHAGQCSGASRTVLGGGCRKSASDVDTRRWLAGLRLGGRRLGPSDLPSGVLHVQHKMSQTLSGQQQVKQPHGHQSGQMNTPAEAPAHVLYAVRHSMLSRCAVWCRVVPSGVRVHPSCARRRRERWVLGCQGGGVQKAHVRCGAGVGAQRRMCVSACVRSWLTGLKQHEGSQHRR